MKYILLFTALFMAGCAVSKNPLRQQVKLLQKGIIQDDTSYVYALPYEEGKTFRVIQGYFSRFTHKERAALDFNMKRGTKITAAREGVVIRVKEDTYFNGRSMDVYIAKLRKYLKDDPKIEIVNIHGNGFRLVVQG